MVAGTNRYPAAVEDLRQIVGVDIAKLERLVKAGRPYEAGLDLPQLKAVTPQGDKRLVALQEAVAAADANTPKGLNRFTAWRMLVSDRLVTDSPVRSAVFSPEMSPRI